MGYIHDPLPILRFPPEAIQFLPLRQLLLYCQHRLLRKLLLILPVSARSTYATLMH